MKPTHHHFHAAPSGVQRHHKKALPTILTIVGAAVGAPYIGAMAGGAVGAGLGTKLSGGSWGDALKSGAFTYGGSQIGGLIGDKLGAGTIGSNFGKAGANNAFGPSFMNSGLGDIIGKSAANQLGAGIANTSLGSAIGGFYGNKMAESAPKAPEMQGPKPFVPTRAGEQQAPDSLKSFGGVGADQLSSNLANQGVYGSGNGPQEQAYFTNLINRRLVDESGKVGDISTLKPIENSYLQNLGLGGYSNSKDLLEAMSKWKAA